MRQVSFVVTLLVGALLLYASTDFPDWGDPNSPASKHLSPYFIEHAEEETHVPNLVSAILADYRNYDTMLETTVVFTAGTAILLLLSLPLSPLARYREPDETHLSEVGHAEPDLIHEWACRILFPPIQLFALYVLAHGHHSPGGGFQGGVILGASYILHAMAFDLETSLKKFPKSRYLLLGVLGVAGYVSLGILCLLMGGSFFDYGALGPILNMSEPDCHSLGILVVETGVALTVASVIFAIYVDLSSAGRHDEGL